METFLDSHSRFIQDPGCRPTVEKETWSPAFRTIFKSLARVMGYYSPQSELARHDSRAPVQQLPIFSTTPACFARHATSYVNITFPLTSSLKHNVNKQKETK